MSHSNTPPVRNLALLTSRSSSLRRVSAAEHHTAEQYSKTGRTKPRKHLHRSDLSWNTRQNFLKIPSLTEAALETERRRYSKDILGSNATPNITRSSDSYGTVPPIINGGDWGCIVRDLETIIVFILLVMPGEQEEIIKYSRPCPISQSEIPGELEEIVEVVQTLTNLPKWDAWRDRRDSRSSPNPAKSPRVRCLAS